MALKLYGISIQLFLCSDAGDLWAEWHAWYAII